MAKRAAQEPDALTMWFTRQRKAWWKKWRWVLIGAGVLTAINLAYEAVNSYLIIQWTIARPDYSAQGWEYHWVMSWRWIRHAFWARHFVVFAVVILSAANLGRCFCEGS